MTSSNVIDSRLRNDFFFLQQSDCGEYWFRASHTVAGAVL